MACKAQISQKAPTVLSVPSVHHVYAFQIDSYFTTESVAPGERKKEKDRESHASWFEKPIGL